MAPSEDRETSTKAKSTPTKAKSASSKEKSTPSKERPFPNLSVTETKLLVLASRFIDSGKVDYDELALSAGVMVSSARTLYRGARRKVDQLFTEAAINEPRSNEDVSAAGSPVAKTKAATKANPRSPKTPRKFRVTKSKTATAPRAVDDHETDLAESEYEGSKPTIKVEVKENLYHEFESEPFHHEPDEDYSSTPGLA